MILNTSQLLGESDPSVTRELNVERVTRFTSLHLQIALGYTVCILIAVAFVFFREGLAWVWYLVFPVLGMSFVSLRAWDRYRLKPRPSEVSTRSVWLLSIFLSIYGVVWGATLTVLVMVSPASSLLMLLIAIGICSIKTTMAYCMPLSVLMFGFLCVTPVAIATAYLDPSFRWVLAALYVVYYLSCVNAVFSSYSALLENLRLRVEHEKLLSNAKDVSDSKNRFIASMSHELRTPLNAISGYAQLLKLDTNPEPAKVDRAMDSVLEASSHLVELIDDVLDISKLESDEIEYDLVRLTPGDVFHEIYPMISAQAEEKGIRVDGAKESDRHIRVDRLRFRQVLLNLLNNAVKYTPKNGSIEFGCYDISDQTLRTYISDTGIGIPEEDQKNIFNQFHRASNVINLHPGTGLGLYHCQRLIEEMGGEIVFESVEGGGTTFYVDFPLDELDVSSSS